MNEYTVKVTLQPTDAEAKEKLDDLFDALADALDDVCNDGAVSGDAGSVTVEVIVCEHTVQNAFKVGATLIEDVFASVGLHYEPDTWTVEPALAHADRVLHGF